jgi:glycosyltransferase involved in cell wall biosynthesis
VSLASLVLQVARRRPDIVHWQFTELPVADAMAMAAIRLARVPQLLTAHELLPWNAGRHHHRLFRLLYRIVDVVVVHNDDQRAELERRFGVDPSRIRVAPLGDYAAFAAPDLAQDDARAALAIPASQPVALFFGALRPSKGLDVLLDAWPQVLERVPDARLVVTGKPYKGLDPTALTTRIAAAGLGASVTTRFEQVDPVDTNRYYRAADVVVLPYLDIGTSGVLRYAYNSGRAVVATAVGEHRSRIVEGQTGYVVPPGDPVALAERLADVLADRPRLLEMGEAARRYAAAEFRWVDSAAQLVRAYEDAVRDGRPTPATPESQSSTRR